jgi:hypothetical protein
MPQGWTQEDGILYNNGLVEVPADNQLRTDILQSRHDSKVAGHPGRAKTLALVRRCYTWPSQRRFFNRYVDGCDSCLRTKPTTQKPYGSLKPLPIPAGPWTDISYDLITNLPPSGGADSILTVIDWLTKMAHFIACRKTMNATEPAETLI